MKRALVTLFALAALSLHGCAVDEQDIAAEPEIADVEDGTSSTEQAVATWRTVCWPVTAFYSIWWEHIDNFHSGTDVYQHYKVQISGLYWSHITTRGGRVGWVRSAALC
jgi:hypothetical protein